MVWVSRNGAEQPLAVPAGAYVIPRVSPDGRRIAVDADRQIWLYDLARGTLSRLTFDGSAGIPLWTPDGKRVAFRLTREGRSNIFWQMADGSGGLERLTTGEEDEYPNSFSPDGQLLAFYTVNSTSGRDIWIQKVGEPAQGAQAFLRTPANETSAKFSPDGRWLAYTSNESGRRGEIYVQPYPGPGGKWQISTDGGTEPAWNRNGRELFYRSGDKMMAVDITTQPAFSAGRPHTLFEARYVSGTVSGNYDVSADGQRFLMMKEGEETTTLTQINVVLNWFEELKRRVPAGTQ